MALLPVQMTVEMISDFISSRILAGAICKYSVVLFPLLGCLHEVV